MSTSTQLLLSIMMVPVFLAINIFYGGYCTSVLWGWFMVPLGLPPITFLHAAGISCVTGAFLGSRGTYRGKPDPDSAKALAGAIGHSFGSALLIPSFLLGVGYIVHINMPGTQ